MTGHTQRMAIAASIVALAAAMSASAQTTSRASGRDMSGTSSRSGTPGGYSATPAARPLGALAWIEQTRTRLGTIEPVRKPSVPDAAASAALPTMASMTAGTTQHSKSRMTLGGGLRMGGTSSLQSPLHGALSGGLTRNARAAALGGTGGN